MSGAPFPRGTVTFLFSDIERSTELIRRTGDDGYAAILADHHRLLREAFQAYGGREIDTAGDGFFVAFASARGAVAAAVAGQRAVATFRWPAEATVRVRMGLHTAEPHHDGDWYVGLGVHRAARICDAAHGGQILVSNATAGIVEDAELPGVVLLDLGEHELKGLPRRQRLFQLSATGLPDRFDRPRTRAAGSGVGTFVATDLAGWRHVMRRLGDEASAALAAEYHAAVAATVERAGGSILEQVADTVIAVFRDAGDAVRAAVAVREALGDFAWPAGAAVEVAAAVHSGRWSGDPRRPAAGMALYRLTRLVEVAVPGQVLVSQATVALLEGDRGAPALRQLGERQLPDFEEPVRLFETV
jgi:class 3 adenylate cyclase